MRRVLLIEDDPMLSLPLLRHFDAKLLEPVRPAHLPATVCGPMDHSDGDLRWLVEQDGIDMAVGSISIRSRSFE